MTAAFDRIATSQTAPRPSDLAQGISLAAIPGYFVLPLAILGIVLIVAGLLLRSPAR